MSMRVSVSALLDLLEECYLYRPRSIGIPEQHYVTSVWSWLGDRPLPVVLRRAMEGRIPFRVSVQPRGRSITDVPEIELVHLDFDLDSNPERAVDEALTIRLL